jgi:hypothetical protein
LLTGEIRQHPRFTAFPPPHRLQRRDLKPIDEERRLSRTVFVSPVLHDGVSESPYRRHVWPAGGFFGSPSLANESEQRVPRQNAEPEGLSGEFHMRSFLGEVESSDG